MKQAPKLKFNKTKPRGNCYILPQETMDYIFDTIEGKNGNAIKLIIVLLGTKEGFGISTSWICQRTGMQKTAYYRARDYLAEIGLITITDKEIIVNI